MDLASVDTGLALGVLATALTYGFRHGFDWDHIAALTDIASSQSNSRRALALSTLYAAGHAVVVFALGVLAIIAGDLIPPRADEVMGRVVGVTLIALGIYVVYSLVRYGRDFRMRSRWMLVFEGVRRLWRRLRPAPETITIEHEHEHVAGHGHHHPVDAVTIEPESGDLTSEPQESLAGKMHQGSRASVLTVTNRNRHRHVGVMPDDPFMSYGPKTALGIGAIHGVGAETPTQVLLFLAAAGVGGGLAGIAVLLAFLAGLFASNTLVAIAAVYGNLNASRGFFVYATVAVLTALFSFVLGATLLLARDAILPALF